MWCLRFVFLDTLQLVGLLVLLDMRRVQTAPHATLSTSVLLITHVRMKLLVSLAPPVIPTTLAHALLIMVEQIMIISIIMCASI